MRIRLMWSRAAGGMFVVSLLCASACTGVPSLDPAIGPGAAITAPTLVGDWIRVDEDDSTWVHVTPGEDATTYVLEGGHPTTWDHVLPLGRPTLELRVAPVGNHLLAEAIPSKEDALVDSVTSRYGTVIQLAYIHGVMDVVGDELRVQGFLTDSVSAALRDRRCPLPGRVIDRNNDLVLAGDSRDVLRTIECLIGIPGALDEPAAIFRRVTTP